MHNSFLRIGCLIVVVILWTPSTTFLVNGASYSGVLVSEGTLGKVFHKAMISLPSVPDLPKISRPGKNPNKTSPYNYNHNLQQQHSRPQQQHQPPKQPPTPTPIEQIQNMVPVPNVQVPSISVPVVPQVPAIDKAPAPVPAPVPEHDYEQESPQYDDYVQQQYSQDDYVQQQYSQGDYVQQQYSQGDYVTYHEDPSDTEVNQVETDTTVTESDSEKNQDIPDFPVPNHVMSILQALQAGGGSLAQASKPEKDGNGFTTANAIGYATGDNATVSATVSNKIEVNTQTVIMTESASASASSTSNGTAFSQASLQSNSFTNGMGGWGWPSSFKKKSK